MKKLIIIGGNKGIGNAIVETLVDDFEIIKWPFINNKTTKNVNSGFTYYLLKTINLNR